MIKKIPFLFILIILLIGCSEKEKPIEIKDFSILNVPSEIQVGQEFDIDVVVIEEVAYTVTITSKNNFIEIANKTIKAIKAGEETINVVLTYDDKKIEKEATFVIKEKEVEVIEVNEINVKNDLSNLFTEDVVLLDIEVLPTNATNKDFIVSFDKEGIVKYEDNKLTMLKSGEVTMKITSGNVIKEINLVVTDKEVLLKDFNVTFSSEQLNLNDTFTYTIVYDPVNVTNKEVVVKSSNDCLVINENKITVVKAGKVSLSFTCSDITKNYEFEIKEIIENTEEITKEILDWALETVGTTGIDEVFFPTTHPTLGGEISFESEDSELVDIESGFLGFPDFDEVCKVTCIVKYKDKSLSKEIPFIVPGFEAQRLCQEFLKPIKICIRNDIDFVTELSDFGGTTITWSSSNQSVFTNKGEYIKPMNDTTITITYEICTTSPQFRKTYTADYVVKGYSVGEKAAFIEEWIYSNVGMNQTIYANTVFPTECTPYDATLEWTTENNEEIVLDKLVSDPITSQGVYLKVKVIIGEDYSFISLFYKVQAKEYSDKWEAISDFFNVICKEQIHTNQYQTFGSVSLNVTNYGYLPFYKSENLDIEEAILPYTYGYIRTNIQKTSTEYIVVHDTGNNSKGSNATAHKNYLNKLNSDEANETYISWHFTTDEDGVIQHLPLDEVAYHAGDGSTTYPNTWSGGLGGGNRNGIGIESCVNEGSDYNMTMRNTAKLVAELLLKFNLGIDRVKQHYDFSGKDCPMTLRHANRWKEFITLVQLEYFGKTELKDVIFKWESLSKDIMDDTGKIINHTGEGTTVKYKCTVTYNNVTKVYEFESKLMKVA